MVVKAVHWVAVTLQLDISLPSNLQGSVMFGK
jgi:hypothetical protein